MNIEEKKQKISKFFKNLEFRSDCIYRTIFNYVILNNNDQRDNDRQNSRTTLKLEVIQHILNNTS